VWLYTGYTIEELVELSKSDENVLDLVNNVDVIVDGPFIESKKDMTLRFRGSYNQRILYRDDIDKYMKVVR
jgi:anaerobic ribonucleoside-triphosphate reductase activating protein